MAEPAPPQAPMAALRSVPWRDLTPMTRREGLIECLHPLPWLLSSWVAAQAGLWWLALPASFLFFLTALRLNHEAVHGNLGFSPRGHRRVLHGLSFLMLGSNHSVAYNHLLHHSRIGTPDDIEGKCGRMSAWRVLAYGPAFPVETQASAWRHGGTALRRRMTIDAGLNAAMIATALGSGATFLLYHLAAMLVAQCLTGFFAVWITHHDVAESGLDARTQRSALVNCLSYNMFLHLEHHLFPAVPVKRLAVRAGRNDAAFPTLATKRQMVLPIPRKPTVLLSAARGAES
ncbi:fatty acid desaturase [Stakelama tenebrarum]|uniref:Fatty acid desaturase n=1 Tax=Stakelama tenebrarum TaxID=2711215 RepID=A0A6G6Y4Q7_9SPHN|nr:fatty acid desaturase [Sphingosinithalassobacter tenebrarum]QIG79912.1 fatty acid desaturase [Sphingosinithalassobacter tenebrarum]